MASRRGPSSVHHAPVLIDPALRLKAAVEQTTASLHSWELATETETEIEIETETAENRELADRAVFFTIKLSAKAELNCN